MYPSLGWALWEVGAIGAAESRTTDVMSEDSKSGRVATLQDQEGTALTVRISSLGSFGAGDSAFPLLRLSL